MLKKIKLRGFILHIYSYFDGYILGCFLDEKINDDLELKEIWISHEKWVSESFNKIKMASSQNFFNQNFENYKNFKKIVKKFKINEAIIIRLLVSELRHISNAYDHLASLLTKISVIKNKNNVENIKNFNETIYMDFIKLRNKAAHEYEEFNNQREKMVLNTINQFLEKYIKENNQSMYNLFLETLKKEFNYQVRS